MKNNLDDAFNITPTEVEVDQTEVKEPVGIPVSYTHLRAHET